MNVVKDVDYLSRFTIQDLIALLQAELKMLSPVKRANEDSESGLSSHVGPSSKRVCLRAQRKGNFFPVRKTWTFTCMAFTTVPLVVTPIIPFFRHTKLFD